jgi:hypothetical protein
MITEHLDKFSSMELNANFNECVSVLNNISIIEGHPQLGFVAIPQEGKRKEAENIFEELTATAELLNKSLNIKLAG